MTPDAVEPTVVGQELRASVLVIDDDAAVRGLVRRILIGHHYRVVEAGNGREGLELVERERVLDAVLTDLTMPGVGGLEVITALARLRPDLPVAAMSGDMRALSACPTVPHLQKPFLPDELLQMVARLVSDVRASGRVSDLRRGSAPGPSAPRSAVSPRRARPGSRPSTP